MSERAPKINVPMLIASFVLSFSLWAVVYIQNLPFATRQLDIDVLVTGIDKEQMAISKGPTTLKVWVTGTEQQLNELRDARRFGVVDLAQATPGEGLFPVTLEPALLRQLAHDSTPDVPVVLELIARRQLAVVVQSTGKLPTNRILLNRWVLDPANVLLRGPRSRVREVAEARVAFDLSGVDPERRTPHVVPVDAVDGDGRAVPGVEVTPSFVALTPILTPAPEEKSANVLVRFRGAPATGYEVTGYRLSRAEVLLEGPSFALATIGSVETEPIRLDGLTKSRSFEVAIRLPTGVTSTRPSRVRVQVDVRRAPNPTPNPTPTAPPSRNAMPPDATNG